MPPALNIAALARRTGVQPDTLRKWEQRYGVIRPDRTPGGQRRYSECDVARVEWLKARLSEGYRIGEAARLLGSAELASAPQTCDELRAALYDAVLRSDAPTLDVLAEQALGVNDVETALTDVFVPVLHRVGDGWASGELSVAQEHMVTGIVRAHLGRLLTDVRGPIRGVAVLACAPGERHDLALLMLAILLRADGWQAAYLGADTPVADALDLASTLHARLLCISATTTDAVTALQSALPPELPDGAAVVVGGQALTNAAAEACGARYLDGALPAAVTALRN